jgi:hypothetical protein
LLLVHSTHAVGGSRGPAFHPRRASAVVARETRFARRLSRKGLGGRRERGPARNPGRCSVAEFREPDLSAGAGFAFAAAETHRSKPRSCPRSRACLMIRQSRS